MDHFCIPAKAPISWVNVPLWEFGEEGWDEVPRCLAMVHHLFFEMLVGPLNLYNVDVIYELFAIGFYWDPMRQMPYTTPEDIIPWLMDRGLWPHTPERKIKRYWNHLRDVGSELGDMSPQGTHHPLWIWGDAANYSKDQNIIVICFGSVLDDATDSIQKCFPLVLCREET